MAHKQPKQRIARARVSRTSTAPQIEDEAEARRIAIESDTEDDGRGFRFRLRYAMDHLQLQQGTPNGVRATDLARKVALNAQTISRYLKGNLKSQKTPKQPDFKTASLLAKELNCGSGWLVFGGRHGRPGDPRT